MYAANDGRTQTRNGIWLSLSVLVLVYYSVCRPVERLTGVVVLDLSGKGGEFWVGVYRVKQLC